MSQKHSIDSSIDEWLANMDEKLCLKESCLVRGPFGGYCYAREYFFLMVLVLFLTR